MPKKKRDKHELVFRLRTYPGDKFVSAWLIERDGVADQCILFGELTASMAKWLADKMEAAGIKVEWEHRPLNPGPPQKGTQAAEKP